MEMQHDQVRIDIRRNRRCCYPYRSPQPNGYAVAYTQTLDQRTYRFADLKEVLAKASPARSGDALAGVAAETDEERMAARMTLADVPLERFLSEPLIPYEQDEVTRLILDEHDARAFDEISDLSVGDFRNWILRGETDTETL